MNAHCFKTVFSKRLGARVAVGEHASSQGKATGASAPAHSNPGTTWGSGFCGALSTTFAFVALAWASPAWAQPQVPPAPTALPTSAQVVQGAVQFNTTAQQLNILQGSDRAAVNWQSFDIGAAAKVNVVQPSAQSVLLNRVGGEAPSQIFGQLQANGQVILVNPNGMVFGKDGSVSAAGFTGSTLNISDADFMAGKERYTRSGTAAATSAIVNRGLIQAAPGGYVALLGASVSNEGRIEAPQGNVFMAAADAVTLPSPTVGLPIGPSGRIRLELTPASISAAVANHKGGTIVTEGGQVYLQAAAVNAALARIIQSGSIDTTGVQGGQVHVLADGGHIRVDGSIKANSTDGSAGGDIYIGRDKDTNVLAAVGDVRGANLESKGGFVETSGSVLKTDGTRVIAKDWLLDPSDITISNSASSNVTGTSPDDITPNGGPGTSSIVQVSTIQSAINAGTNVTIKTTNALNSNGAGNITIANALSLDNTGAQDATLSLIADNGIFQNAAITATGSRLVHISMTANGNFQGNTVANTNSRGITLNAGITTNGNITLTGTNQSGAAGSAGAGVHINGATVNAGTTGDVTIIGAATNGSGVLIDDRTIIKGRDITLTGTGNASTSGTGVRFNFNTWSPSLQLEAVRNLNITGTLNASGTATGSGVQVASICCSTTLPNGAGILMTATSGEAKITGIQTGNASNTRSAVYLTGLKLNASGNVSIQAQAASSNSLAIHMQRGGGTLNSHPDGAQMRVRSINGDVLIQANQGAVLGQDAGAVLISGRNVTLDNTGAGMVANMSVGGVSRGSIDNTTGAIVLGDGTSTFSTSVTNWWSESWMPLGVSLRGASGLGNSTDGVTATGNLTIGGSSSAAQGVVVGSGMTVGGNINLAARSTQSGTNALDINAALTSNGGVINLSADTMNIGAAVRAGTAGTNTVTVKTVTAAHKIDIGSGMGTSGVDAAETLGLSQAELNRISAGNLIIGDVANTGGIQVSAATTTNVTSGHLTLHTGGNIAVDGALTVGGTTPSKNLTLNGAGATSQVTQTAAIKAAGLELLGSGATHTLNHTGNDIKKLAGNTAKVSLTNNAAFAIDTVNTEGLTSVDTTLNSTAAVTQTQAIRASGLELLGAGGNYTLNHADNTIKKLAGDTGSVSLTNKGDLYISTVDSVDGLKGTGMVSITTTAVPADAIPGDLILRKNLNAANINLNAEGAVLRDDAASATDGILQATSLLRIKVGSNIGTSDSRIQTNVTTLSMESRGDQFVTEANAVTVAARTSNNGSIDIATSNGTLTVGSSTLIDGTTAINGITAHGTGAITLTGTSNKGNGLFIDQAVTAVDGNIALNGYANGTDTTTEVLNGTGVYINQRTVSTKGDMKIEGTSNANNRSNDVYTGVRNFFATVSARNIELKATAWDTTADVLGYFGQGGKLIATGTLDAIAESKGAGAGFYMAGTNARVESGTGMNIEGISNTADGVSVDFRSQVVNKATGNMVLKGSTADTTTGNGVVLATGVIVENASANGGIEITARKGNIRVNSGAATVTNAGSGAVVLSAGPTLAGDSGGIDGTNLTITQNGNGGVQVKTSGTGHVITPKIVNAGTGAVIVAAGTAIGKGDGSGGQVKTAAGNTISQTNATPGKTYIYTGDAANTSALSGLGVFGADLYLSAIGANTKNAASNKAFADGPIAGGANAQVMFRERIALDGVALNAATITYGDSTGSANLKTALQTANPSTGTGSGVFSQTTASTAGRFNISFADLAADSTSNVDAALAVATNKSSSGNLKANTTIGYALEVVGNDFNLTNVTAKLMVERLALTGNIASGSSTYGSTLTAGAVILTNKVGDDVVSSTGVTITTTGNTSTSGNLRAGNYTGIQSVSGLTGTDADNYTFANVKGDYNVDRLALTGSIAASSSTYGATLTTGAVTLSNKVGTDDVSATGVSTATAGNTSTSGNLRAGSYTGIQSVSGLTGTDADNYTFANVKGDYNVDRLALTGSIAASSSTYGATLTTGAVTLSNKVGTDDVSATGVSIATAGNTSTSGNLRAGSYTGIQSVSGLTGTDADNYTFANVKGDYNVDRLVLTSSIAAVSTVYGTVATTGAVAVSAGLVNDDVRVSPTATATLVGAVTTGSGNLAAGSYQQSADAALVGVDAGNYTTAPTTVANYVVTPRVINASVTAADKVYDGSAAATLVATSADILAGDVVNVTGLTGSFASRNVARDGAGNVLAQAVTVSGSGAALGGADGANYVLGNAASVPATTARITPRDLSVSGITASDKVYDGNTTAVVSAVNAVLSNAVAGDSVAVSTQNAQGNFADKDVSRGGAGQVLAKTVQISGLQLQGTDSGNYNLQTSGVSAQASITPRPVTLSGNSAADKVADGTTTAQVTAGSLSGLVAGEGLSVNAQGEFEDALVGTNKVVNARFALQNGALGLASNYQLSNPVEVLRASIVAFVPGKVSPEPIGGGRPSGNRVSFGGGTGTGAATGVIDEPLDPEMAEQCSALSPQKCECVDTQLPGLALCYATIRRVSLKD